MNEDMDFLTVKRIPNLHLELTNFCNLRCVYCCGNFRKIMYEQGKAEARRQVDTQAALVLAQSASHFGCEQVSFIGYGEPTVHPDWLRIAQSFQQAGIQTSIITNLAKSFSEEEIEALARMRQIWISIDTADPELFAALRKGHSLERFLETLGRIVRCAERLKTKPAITANAVVGCLTVYSLEALHALLEKCGVHVLGLLPLSAGPEARPLTLEDGTPLRLLKELEGLEAAKALLAIRRLEKKAKSSSLRVYVQPSIIECLETSPLSLEQPSFASLCYCSYIFNTAYVDCAGNVLFCNSSRFFSTKPLGNIREGSMLTMYNHSRMQNARRTILKGVLKEYCLACCNSHRFASKEEFMRVIYPCVAPL